MVGGGRWAVGGGWWAVGGGWWPVTVSCDRLRWRAAGSSAWPVAWAWRQLGGSIGRPLTSQTAPLGSLSWLEAYLDDDWLDAISSEQPRPRSSELDGEPFFLAAAEGSALDFDFSASAAGSCPVEEEAEEEEEEEEAAGEEAWPKSAVDSPEAE